MTSAFPGEDTNIIKIRLPKMTSVISIGKPNSILATNLEFTGLSQI
jgi:hypothetical protein